MKSSSRRGAVSLVFFQTLRKMLFVALFLVTIFVTVSSTSGGFNYQQWEADLQILENPTMYKRLDLGQWNKEGKGVFRNLQHKNRYFSVEFKGNDCHPELVWRKTSGEDVNTPAQGSIKFSDITQLLLRDGWHNLVISGTEQRNRRLVIPTESEIMRLINIVTFQNRNVVVAGATKNNTLMSETVIQIITDFQQQRGQPGSSYAMQQNSGCPMASAPPLGEEKHQEGGDQFGIYSGEGKKRYGSKSTPSYYPEQRRHTNWSTIPAWVTRLSGGRKNNLSAWYGKKLAIFRDATMEMEKATSIKLNEVGKKTFKKNRRLSCLWKSGWRPEGWKKEWDERFLDDPSGPREWHKNKKTFTASEKYARKDQMPTSYRKKCREISWAFAHFPAPLMEQPIHHNHRAIWEPSYEYLGTYSKRQLQKMNDEIDEYLPNFITAPKEHKLGLINMYTAQNGGFYQPLGSYNRGESVGSENSKWDWTNADTCLAYSIQTGIKPTYFGSKKLYRGYRRNYSTGFNFTSFFNNQRVSGKAINGEYDYSSMRGRHFFLKSPGSSSHDFRQASTKFYSSGGFILEITKATGYDLKDTAIYGKEKEVLLPAGSTMKINRVVKEHGRWIVKCEMVGTFKLEDDQVRELTRRARVATTKVPKYFNTTYIYKEVGPIESFFKTTYMWQYKRNHEWFDFTPGMLEQVRKYFPNGPKKHKHQVGASFVLTLDRGSGTSYTLYVGNKPSCPLYAGQQKGKSNCMSVHDFKTGFYQIANQKGELNTRWITPIRCVETEYAPL